MSCSNNFRKAADIEARHPVVVGNPTPEFTQATPTCDSSCGLAASHWDESQGKWVGIPHWHEVTNAQPDPSLTFAEYEKNARSTATYDKRASVVYPLLGLCGEAGEVAEKLQEALYPMGPPMSRRSLDYQIFYVLDSYINHAKSCEQLKKMIRDRTDAELVTEQALDGLAARVNAMTGEEEAAVGKEISDVLWYSSVLPEDLGLHVEQLAKDNLAKLKSRQERGKLSGSGDHR